MGPNLGPTRDDTQAQGVGTNARIPAGAGPAADDLTIITDFGAVVDRAAAFAREGRLRMDVPAECVAQDAGAACCVLGPGITRKVARPDVVVSADITRRVDPITGTGEIVIARVAGRSAVRAARASDVIVASAASCCAPPARLTALTRTGWARHQRPPRKQAARLG